MECDLAERAISAISGLREHIACVSPSTGDSHPAETTEASLIDRSLLVPRSAIYFEREFPKKIPIRPLSKQLA